MLLLFFFFFDFQSQQFYFGHYDGYDANVACMIPSDLHW